MSCLKSVFKLFFKACFFAFFTRIIIILLYLVKKALFFVDESRLFISVADHDETLLDCSLDFLGFFLLLDLFRHC